MPMLGVREFARSVSRVIDQVTDDQEPVIITRHGKPAVAILPLDPDRWQSLAIAAAPQLLRSLRAADAELAAGTMRSLDDAVREPASSQPKRAAAAPRKPAAAKRKAARPASKA